MTRGTGSMDTKMAIKDQFMKEYARKDFSRITVKGLCSATPVARTTFYSYYNNTDEVRCEIEDELISGIVAVSQEVAAGNYPDMDFEIFMDETEEYIRKNWVYIHAFLVEQPNHRFIRKWKDAIKENFGKSYPDKVHAKNYEAISEIVASPVLSSYAYWMEHPDTSSIDEAKPLIKKVLDSLASYM